MLTDILASALHPPTEISKGTHDVRHRTTWLRNMKLDEVSLVPKGANRRRFTVFKSADGGPDALFDRLESALTEWLAATN